MKGKGNGNMAKHSNIPSQNKITNNKATRKNKTKGKDKEGMDYSKMAIEREV